MPTAGLVRKALGGEAPQYDEDSRGEELEEYAAQLAEQLPLLPVGPYRSQVEAELVKAQAAAAESKVSGALRPLI
jgi:hypothetical protein